MSVARDGLASLHGRMRVVRPGEPETGLGALLSAPGAARADRGPR